MYKNIEKFLIKCRQMYREVTNNASSHDMSFKISMNKFELSVVKQDNTRHAFYRCQKITISNIRLVPSIAMIDNPSRSNKTYQTPQDRLIC